MERQAEPKKRKWKKILGISLLALLICAVAAAAILYALDGRHVRFYLTGPKDLVVAYGQEFQDPGVTAVSVGDVFGEGEEQLPVSTDGYVNTNEVGTYELAYSTHMFLWKYSTVRKVHVADLTPPTITLREIEGYEPSWFTGYEEEGYMAFDDLDGDVTDQVQRETLPDGFRYTVTDRSGNSTSVERHPHFTITEPEIVLEGGEEVELPASLSFSDPGFSAHDTLGNDLSSYIQVEGEVIPYHTGDYTRTYTITNELGDSVSVTRTIHVVPVRNPDTVQPDGRTIYLTFDDGPGPYTAQLLDLLAAYNVKATFFVTCLNPDYEDMVGRAYREGHSIGVHSASHNYYAIYASEEAYLDDFDLAEEMIYRQTGSYTRLFRFPGGSSNTVSRFNKGIMTRLARTMEDMGYCYFDWNVSSGDAGETTKTKQVISNIQEGCKEYTVSIVLQHDIKDYSVNAVERVLIWGINNGYTFRALDETSPGAHHTIAN